MDTLDKDNKNVKSKNVREFTVPLDLQELDDETCDCFIRTFDRGTPEQCCSMREKVEGLAAKLEAEFKIWKAKHSLGLCSGVLDGHSSSVFEER